MPHLVVLIGNGLSVAANENLRLQNLFDGMQVYAGLIAHLGRLWPQTP